jgi:hypothetical protein
MVRVGDVYKIENKMYVVIEVMAEFHGVIVRLMNVMDEADVIERVLDRLTTPL